MEMHQVRYVLAVADELNFTRAAEACHVSQPALSRAVQQLEGELGGQLFARERGDTHLTELGRMVLPHLEQVYAEVQQAKHRAKAFLQLERTPLKLGKPADRRRRRCTDGGLVRFPVIAEASGGRRRQHEHRRHDPGAPRNREHPASGTAASRHEVPALRCANTAAHRGREMAARREHESPSPPARAAGLILRCPAVD